MYLSYQSTITPWEEHLYPTEGQKIKDFTLIRNACHQNIEGKIVIFVSSVRSSRKIRDYSSYELNYI